MEKEMPPTKQTTDHTTPLPKKGKKDQARIIVLPKKPSTITSTPTPKGAKASITEDGA
jgi:hypothetical protein